MNFTFSDAPRPVKTARARALRRGLLLSASAGWALSHAALPARAQVKPASAGQNGAAQKALRLAKSQEAAGSLALAAASFRDAASQAPTDAAMARELARFYTRQNRDGEARAAWTRLSELKPADAEAGRELARLRSSLAASPDTGQGASVGNDAPLPPAEGFAPRTVAVASTRSSVQAAVRSLPLPPVSAKPKSPATRGGSLLAQVPASEMPSLPETVQAPSPEPQVPIPQTTTPAPGSDATASEQSATTPDATTPDAITPDATTPDATTPNATTPNATTPNATTPDAITPAPEGGTTAPDATTSLPSTSTGDSTEVPPVTSSPAPSSVAVRAVTGATTSRPALAPVAASARVTPVAFVPPTASRVRTPRKRAARAWPYVNRGAKLLNQKRAAQALIEYQSAAQIDPNNAYALPGVATSQIILGRFDEAAQTYRRFLAIKPNDAKGLRGLADALTFGRNYREALGVNNYILASRDPRNFAAQFQNGQIYTFLKSYASADAAFGRALSIEPDNIEALNARGESLSYRRDPRAVASFERVLKLEPGNARARIGIGNSYLYSGQFPLAVPRFKAVLATQPNNVEALVSLGEALSFSDQPGAAVSPYARAVGLAPSNLQARAGLGRALVYSGRLSEGVTQLNQVLRAEPNNTSALEALALAQSRQNSPAADATYARLLGLQRDPAARARTFAARGDAQMSQNDLTEENRLASATRSYAQAVQLAPSDARFALIYAQLLSYQKQWPETARAARRALDLSPGNPQAQAVLLQAALKSNPPDTATATRLAGELENAAPKSAQASLDLAQALRDAGNTAAATRLLLRAASQTADPALSLKIAEVTRDAGDYPNATALYARLLQLNPGNTAARLGLAQTRLYARDLTGAQAQLAQLPNNRDAQLLRAQIGLRLGTPESRDESARIATSILAADPSNAAAATILSDALTTRQRFADAVAQLRPVVAADPNNVEARLRLARNLNYSRDFEGAIAQYRELISRAPADALPRLELAQILLDRSRYSEAEALFNEVLVLRRGTAMLPSVRRAIASNSLQRLSPLSRDDSPVFVRVAALIQLHQSSQLARKGATSAQTAPARRLQVPKQSATRLAQNTTASGPTLPGTTGDIAGAAGTPGNATGVTPTPDAATPGTSAGAQTTPEAPTTTAPATTLPAVTPGSVDSASPAAPLDVPAPTASGAIVPGTADATSGGAANGGTLDAPLATGQSDQGAALRGLGESRRRQGLFAEALTFFTQALTLNPNDVPARVGLAQSLRGQNQFAQAGEQVQSVLSLEPANIPARVLSAQLLADTGQTAEANTQLNALVSSLPANAPLESYTQLALALNSVNNYPASLDLLSRAVAQYPTEPSVARLRAETLGFAGQTDESVTAFDALLSTDPNDNDALLGKARVFNYANRLPEAEATYRQVLSAQSSNFSALSELADVLGRRGNFSEGITLYGQAIGQNPGDLPTRVNLARLQRSAGQTTDAEATLNQVIEADPNNVAALSERGSLRGSQGSYAAGLADLQRAISLAPNNQNAQLGLAQVQSYSGNYAQSIASYQAFLARNPNNAQARVELAQALSYSRRSPEALRELDTVLSQTPGYASALLARADILAREGRTNDAVAQYNAILASDPNNARARTGLADAFLYGRRYNEAIRVYDQLLRAQPNDVSLRISRARALTYAGRSKEAVSALRAIVAADGLNIPARLALAEAGTNSGDATLQRDAIGEYRQILKAAPDNLNAQLGLARVLSYRGQYGESKGILNRILASDPNNNDARLALANTQSFAGDPFGAKENYKRVAKNTNSVAAQNGLSSVHKATSPSIGVNGSYYSDSNGVRLRSIGENAILRTRLLTIGALASQGKFRQRGFAERNRTTIGVLLARQFGPLQAQLIVSRLKYSGVSEKTLYDFALGRDFNPRSRVGLSLARRDIFETDLAVSRGITADTVSAVYTLPLGSRLDLETRAAYYDYSDNNSRVTLSPSLFFRFSPTNPTFRAGVGYTYENTRQTRDAPFVYYTPQNFNAASVLADYVVTQGATRYNVSGSYPLTSSTGRNGFNRPAATLFGSLERDLSDNFDVFIGGGLVRVPNGSFHSEQVSGGVNLRF
jgi:tetratricopeptide (TPR) repeat protein